MIKAVILDCDGVLLESAQVKTRAFRALFQEICPDRAEEAVAYHLANEGISRYAKFQAIYAELLRQPLSSAKSRELGCRFAALVEAELPRAPLVAGAQAFLEQACSRYQLFVASGTPEDELRALAEARGLTDWILEWHGSPRTKPQIIREILQRHRFVPSEAVLVGDAVSDLQAAQETGVTFIGRADGSDGRFAACAYRISDLRQLPELLQRLQGQPGGAS